MGQSRFLSLPLHKVNGETQKKEGQVKFVCLHEDATLSLYALLYNLTQSRYILSFSLRPRQPGNQYRLSLVTIGDYSLQ